MLSFRRIACCVICVVSAVYAQLPDNFIIKELDGTGVRDAYPRTIRYEFASDKNYHPYFIESVNAILHYYGSNDTLVRHIGHYSDTTLQYYLDELDKAEIAIYKMDKLQGKSLRSLLYGGIPILMLGTAVVEYYNKERLHADVIYRYRMPFQQESSNKLEEDRKHLLCSVRGFQIETREYYPPVSREYYPQEKSLSNTAMSLPMGANKLFAIHKLHEFRVNKWMADPLKRPPYDIFESFCVVVTKERTLDKIRQIVENGLTDAALEYKAPGFRKLNGKDLIR